MARVCHAILPSVSEENVALVRRNYEVINSTDWSGEEFVDPEEAAPDLWAGLSPDLELHGRGDLPDQVIYRGRDQTKDFWRMIQEVWAELRWEPLEFTDLGHAIVVETRLVGRGRGSDVPISAEETDVFWFREGKLVRVQAFAAKDEALEAARASAG
jgi:ketosteroid isomerase-like protein